MSPSLAGTAYMPIGNGCVVCAGAPAPAHSSTQRRRRIMRRILIEQRRLGRGLRVYDLTAAEVFRAVVDLDHSGQSIRILWLLVPANPLDAWETQRVAAGVTVGLLDLVARDLEDDLRLDLAD